MHHPTRPIRHCPYASGRLSAINIRTFNEPRKDSIHDSTTKTRATKNVVTIELELG